MNYNLPINEKDFLVTLNAALSSTDKEKKDELFKQLEEINKPKNDIFEKLEYQAQTDSEIEKAASELTESEYIKKMQNLINQYAGKAESTGGLKDSVSARASGEKQAVIDHFEESKKQSENQALKRGLGRSSVIMNVLERYDDKKNQTLSGIEKSLSESLAAIDNQLLILEAERQRSIDNLEIDKSVDTAKKIKELKDERDKKIAEVTKFNNEVAEKNLKYQTSAQPLTKEEQQKVDHAKAKLILDFYSGKTEQEIYDDFSGDNRFREYLGDYYSTFSQILRARAQNAGK